MIFIGNYEDFTYGATVIGFKAIRVLWYLANFHKNARATKKAREQVRANRSRGMHVGETMYHFPTAQWQVHYSLQ